MIYFAFIVGLVVGFLLGAWANRPSRNTFGDPADQARKY